MPRWPLIVASLALSTAACSRGISDALASSPNVRLLDSLLVAEPDSLEGFFPLRTQAVAAAGDLYAETGTSILHFDREGRLRSVIGRPGNGPGEFIRISTIALLPGDSLLAAVDARRARIVVFGALDGVLRRERMVTPFFPDQQSVIYGDTVIFPSKLSPTPFTSWVPRTDSVWSWGRPPALYSKSLKAYSQGGEPSLAPYKDGWVALYPAEAPLIVLASHGDEVGTVSLPVRHRLGVPADLPAAVEAITASGTFRFAASLVLAIHRLSDGTYLLIHLDTDATVEKSYTPANGGKGILFSNMRYWVSLVSPDLTRACVDGLVPLVADNVYSPFFENDHLLFLTRSVDSLSRLRSVLYRFTVASQGCEWIPTGGIQTSEH